MAAETALLVLRRVLCRLFRDPHSNAALTNVFGIALEETKDENDDKATSEESKKTKESSAKEETCVDAARAKSSRRSRDDIPLGVVRACDGICFDVTALASALDECSFGIAEGFCPDRGGGIASFERVRVEASRVLSLCIALDLVARESPDDAENTARVVTEDDTREFLANLVDQEATAMKEEGPSSHAPSLLAAPSTLAPPQAFDPSKKRTGTRSLQKILKKQPHFGPHLASHHPDLFDAIHFLAAVDRYRQDTLRKGSSVEEVLAVAQSLVRRYIDLDHIDSISVLSSHTRKRITNRFEILRRLMPTEDTPAELARLFRPARDEIESLVMRAYDEYESASRKGPAKRQMRRAP